MHFLNVKKLKIHILKQCVCVSSTNLGGKASVQMATSPHKKKETEITLVAVDHTRHCSSLSAASHGYKD